VSLPARFNLIVTDPCFVRLPLRSHLPPLPFRLPPSSDDPSPNTAAQWLLEKAKSDECEPNITFKLPDSKSFFLLGEDHLIQNDIRTVGVDEVPQALQRFQDHLKRKRHILDHVSAVVVCVAYITLSQEMLSSSLQQSTNSFSTHFVEGPSPVDTNQLDLVTLNELVHYIHIFGSSELLNPVHYEEDKESQVRCFLQDFLALVQVVPAKWGL
jgi:hypothetical protein